MQRRSRCVCVCIVCAYVSVLSHLFVNIMTGCRIKIKQNCKNYVGFHSVSLPSPQRKLGRLIKLEK